MLCQRMNKKVLVNDVIMGLETEKHWNEGVK